MFITPTRVQFLQTQFALDRPRVSADTVARCQLKYSPGSHQPQTLRTYFNNRFSRSKRANFIESRHGHSFELSFSLFRPLINFQRQKSIVKLWKFRKLMKRKSRSRDWLCGFLIINLSSLSCLLLSPCDPQHRLFMFGIKFYGHEKKEIRRRGKIDYILLSCLFL